MYEEYEEYTRTTNKSDASYIAKLKNKSGYYAKIVDGPYIENSLGPHFSRRQYIVLLKKRTRKTRRESNKMQGDLFEKKPSRKAKGSKKRTARKSKRAKRARKRGELKRVLTTVKAHKRHVTKRV